MSGPRVICSRCPNPIPAGEHALTRHGSQGVGSGRYAHLTSPWCPMSESRHVPRRLFGPALMTLATLAAPALGVAGCSGGPAPTSAPNTPGQAPDEPVGPPLFEDITAASGIQFTYRNGEDTANHLSILESLGGGVGLIDYDGDGRLDVFLPGGGRFDGADKKDIVGLPCKLYRNLGGSKFRDVTAEVGLDKLAGGKPWFYSHGVAVADYDRDGWPDILVTGWG